MTSTIFTPRASRVALAGVFLVTLVVVGAYLLAAGESGTEPTAAPAATECPRAGREAGAPRTTLTPGFAADDVQFEDLRFIRNAVVVEQVAGMTVDEAVAWGEERGWAEVRVDDLAAQPLSQPSSANLVPSRFTIYHCSGIVTWALVG